MSETEALVLDPLQQRLRTWREALRHTPAFTKAGRLVRINGLVMEAMGLKLPLGASCRIETPTGGTVEAEVVGFQGDKLFLMPTEEVYGLAPGARVLPPEPPPIPLHADELPETPSPDRAKHLPAGEALLGRVVDAAGLRSMARGRLPAPRCVRSSPRRSIRSRARPSTRRSTSASARSMRCSPSAAVSGWGFSPARG
jgi:flagellum-specific ATP synthase